MDYQLQILFVFLQCFFFRWKLMHLLNLSSIWRPYIYGIIQFGPKTDLAPVEYTIEWGIIESNWF